MSATDDDLERAPEPEDEPHGDDDVLEDVLTLTDAARACGVARSTMRRFVQQQRFPNAHRGNGNGQGNGPWRIPRGDLVAAGLLAPGEQNGNGAGPTSPVVEDTALVEHTTEEPASDARVRELESEVARLRNEAHLSSVLADERDRTIEELRLALHTIEVDLETAPIEYQPRRARPRLRRNITFLVMLAAVGALLYALTRLGDDTAPSVEVPDLVSGNPPVGQVEEIPDELQLDSVVRLTASEDTEPGRVLAQDPRPGARLTEGEEVTIVVSAGAGSTEVPGIVDAKIDEARSALFFAGLNVADPPEIEPSEDEEPGTVLRTEPEPGTTLQRGGEVTVVVSGGKES